LTALVDHSLVQQAEDPGGEPRFTMLETIREFAQERLNELPEADALRQAHADTFLALAEKVNREDVSAEVDLLNRLEADHANFRQAIAYYSSQGEAGLAQRVRLVAALAHFWRTHGHLAEGRHELEEAIAAKGDIPPAACAPAIKGAALVAEAQGDLDGAERLNAQVLALQRELGDLAGVADSLTGLGVIARQRGDLKTARSRHQEALDAWRRVGDEAGAAGALLDLGLIRQLEGDYVGAEPAFKESLGLFRRLGDDLGEAHALHYLGLLAMATASLPEAITWFEESLRLWHAMSIRQMIATDFANLGEAHHLRGSFDEAERLYREALTLFETLGDPRGQGFVLGLVGRLALDRGNPEGARDPLRKSLRLLWGAGLRGSAADALEALAEANWRLGELDVAAQLLQTADRLREETGLVRQPVYESRYQQILAAVSDHRLAAPVDVDQTVATAIGQVDFARASR
jgi:tetratricopeptide (TPR) repeat protein